MNFVSDLGLISNDVLAMAHQSSVYASQNSMKRYTISCLPYNNYINITILYMWVKPLGGNGRSVDWMGDRMGGLSWRWLGFLAGSFSYFSHLHSVLLLSYCYNIICVYGLSSEERVYDSFGIGMSGTWKGTK